MSGGWLIAPYALWMLLMTALPSTSAMYAVRTLAVAVLLLIAGWRWRRELMAGLRPDVRGLAWGVLVGLAVFVIWVWPERFEWYRRWFILGEGGTAEVDQSPVWLLAFRLVGSAFVISVAEELFFRKWLIRFAGFGWMVVLFALEHDRWLVGAIAGVAYGWLYLRRGLFGAVVAHAVTNLVLGLWVLYRGAWQFW